MRSTTSRLRASDEGTDGKLPLLISVSKRSVKMPVRMPSPRMIAARMSGGMFRLRGGHTSHQAPLRMFFYGTRFHRGLKQCTKRIRNLGFRIEGGNGYSADGLHITLEGVQEERGFVAKQSVEARLRYPGGARDAFHIDPVEAVGPKHLNGAVKRPVRG